MPVTTWSLSLAMPAMRDIVSARQICNQVKLMMVEPKGGELGDNFDLAVTDPQSGTFLAYPIVKTFTVQGLLQNT